MADNHQEHPLEQESAPREGAPSSSPQSPSPHRAGAQRVEARPDRNKGLLSRLQRQEIVLRSAYQHFIQLAEETPVQPYAAEWILDNFHIVQQSIREIREDMPRGYYRKLPRVEGTPPGAPPRVYALAERLIWESSVRLDTDRLQRSVNEYQRVTPLTIGELWALPTMLRLGIIDALARAIAQAIPVAGVAGKEAQALTGPEGIAGTPLPAIPADTVVANSILSLRALDVQDWKVFFENTSLVEQILDLDPAQVYAQMDFDTRDCYRKEVETLALATGESEVRVAEVAIELAAAAAGTPPPTFGGEGPPPPAEQPFPATAGARNHHVGYYLIAQGRQELEARLGYRPTGWDRLHCRLLDHPTPFYLGSIGLIALILIAGLAVYAVSEGASALGAVGIALLLLIPAVTIATSLVNWLVLHLLEPQTLPKLEFKEGIPDEYRTMVVIPTLLTDVEEVESLLRQLELHFLRNSEPNIYFALLTDFGDAPEQQQPGDQEVLNRAREGIRALNKLYQQEQQSSFFLFHRERRWNPQEHAWMGWERKRGKLEEFNRLLLGQGETSYIVQDGDLSILPDVRYVITLDADTVLPRNGARRLVGTLAHPLNRAEFDPQTGQVVAGYTVLQPRTEVKPTSGNISLFTRIYAGDRGLDLYTKAVSDVYQDLFGEGIYVGKGIYDLVAFARSLEDRTPDNTLLSHDLFEGILGRAGLVTDIVLYEDYPPGYIAYTLRQHRWIRGDWQLLPWLLPKVPRKSGGRARNPLPVIDRWKILDNLRRSLLPLVLLLLLALAWLVLPGWSLWWTLFAIVTPLMPVLTGTVDSLIQGGLGELRRSSGKPLLRWLLELAFLPDQAMVALDAIVVTLIRMLWTRRHLLEWTTAARVARLFSRADGAEHFWRTLAAAPLLALGIGAITGALHPAALPVAALLLLAWAFSPQIAYWISRPIQNTPPALTQEDRQSLRNLARRTWLYFEQFVGPEDNWLPPDHFQESPRGMVAHHTSPTNIGLALLAMLTAYDLGYISLLDLSVRLRYTFGAMDSLEKYRGHLMNWYDTRTLKPLSPRYVSTVDSGNLAACLVALRHGCLELITARVPRLEQQQGLFDVLNVLEEIVDVHIGAPGQGAPIPVARLLEQLGLLHHKVQDALGFPERWPALLGELLNKDYPGLEERLVQLVEAEPEILGAAALRSLRLWLARTRYQLTDMHRELEDLAPWLMAVVQPPELLQQPDGALAEAWQAFLSVLPAEVQVNRLDPVCAEVGRKLETLLARLDRVDAAPAQLYAAREWCMNLRKSLRVTQETATSLELTYASLARECEKMVAETDFAFLYSVRRQVFHIGYNVDAEKPDDSYYDLLASEARIASLLAIAKGDVPYRHWLHMARPLTMVEGMRTLLSWNGSMFEYLMPILLLRRYQNTLLDESNQAAVQRQIEYAGENRVPWGISESSYYAFDPALNYQYRGFGVPGLGFKRGLGDDLVIAPYASFLALPLQPQAVVSNARRLAELRALGTYGFYESVDFTSSRLPLGQKQAVVRTYMVHHLGMTLLSLLNYLNDQPMVRRFHDNPLIQSVELLLQEQIPYHAPIEEPPEESAPLVPTAPPHVSATPWRAPLDTPFPLVHYLANGHYGLLVSNSGGGYSRWEETDLTRWRADTTLDDWGMWLYIRDQESGALWSVGEQPCPADGQREVFFYPHKIDLHCTAHEIAAQVEITVPPDDDVEIRRVRLTNQGDYPRRLLLCSYAEVILTGQDVDRRHPAFNKLFIESEYRPEVNGLLFRRRAYPADEPSAHLLHCLFVEPGMPIQGAYESDRAHFLGRGRSPRNPAALGGELVGLTGTTGATLDPIMAMAQQVEIPPHASVRVAWVNAVAESRRKAVVLARRYQDWEQIERAFGQARSQAEIEMRQMELDTAEVERIELLLSLLTYPHPVLRADPAVLAANTEGQPRLWPYSISGDYPILLACVGEEDDLALLPELLRAHTYWRNRGIKIDMVIVNEKERGYSQELQGMLNRLLVTSHNEAWLNRHGGIFVILRESMTEEDKVLLNTAARVFLDGAKGPLAEQLKDVLAQPPYLPIFVPPRAPTEVEEPIPPLLRPEDLRFDNGLGGFASSGHEYVTYVDRERWTPAPWINVIANAEAGFTISEAGSGCSWAINSGENRLTPWTNDPVRDPSGEALYLRDEETGEVWSPTLLPAGTRSPYLVRHSAGRTIVEHQSHGLLQEMHAFVVRDAPVKVVRLRLENQWSRVRRITITYYAEWVLGTIRDKMQQYIIPEYDASSQALLARNPYNVDFGARVAFLAASKEPHGLTTNRTEFLGRLGSRARPAALARIGLSGSVQPGVDPCAAIQLHVDLPPGVAEEVCFLLGQGENRDAALQLVHEYKAPGRVAAAEEEVLAFWDRLLGALTVQTPDPAMNLLLNHWLLYQALSCRVWGRTALYQSSGAYGFRDQLQDVLALVHVRPDLTREHILRCARRQFEAGDVLHWWHPPESRGVRTRVSDDLLWLPYVTARYISATGDLAILKEEEPFLRGEPLKPDELERYSLYPATDERYTLYDHCRRAVAKGSTAGPRGLPLFGTGDWNDGMNRVGVDGLGESVWLAWFLHATLLGMAPLCDSMGDQEEAARYRERAAKLEKALQESAWDGEWYVRGYYDDGLPLGSSRNQECQIDSIAQSWALLSHDGAPADQPEAAERARRAMESVRRRLVRFDDQLILLFTPPFDRTPRNPGYIKDYPPGIRENGGQYTHAAIWSVWAFALLGQGDRAEALFRLLNPIYHSETGAEARNYRVEPYVIAADVYSVPPYVDRGGWTWYTGSAAWMYRLGIETILGVRQTGKLLRIDPCIPRDWPGFNLSYHTGSTTYQVHVENSAGVNHGVVQVMLDGQVIPGQDVEMVDDGKKHQVHVLMG